MTVNSSWSFITFCLQMTEYINFTSNFRVDGITNYAISDPSTRGGGADGKDFLDPRTAWLYTQFTNGTLQGYNYTRTLALT